MKKIIVALVCATQMACFGMSQKELEKSYFELLENVTKTQQTSLEVQERQVKALELFALSQALETCRPSNRQSGPRVSDKVCEELRKKFEKIATDF